MKGCFSLIIACFLVLVTLGMLRYWALTPEERAVEKAAFAKQQEAAAQQGEEERRTKILKRVELDELRPQFVEWLQRNAGVSTARFNEDTLEVKLEDTPLNKDVARVKAESLAHAWRLRAGLEHAECSIYFGNEIHATGADSGPVSEIYLARKRYELEEALSGQAGTIPEEKASEPTSPSEDMQAKATAAMGGQDLCRDRKHARCGGFQRPSDGLGRMAEIPRPV